MYIDVGACAVLAGTTLQRTKCCGGSLRWRRPLMLKLAAVALLAAAAAGGACLVITFSAHGGTFLGSISVFERGAGGFADPAYYLTTSLSQKCEIPAQLAGITESAFAHVG